MIFTKEWAPRLSNSPSKKKEISRHIINKRADTKLNYVVDKYKLALGAYIKNTRDRFLDKDILFDNLRYVDEINLKYQIENRFWAISYNLLYRSILKCTKIYCPDTDCMFTAILKGKMRINDAEFTSDTDDEKVTKILRKLNNPLIIDRVTALDLTDLRIIYRADIKTWEIGFRSLIGSTTWNFIPPVTYLIKPKNEECVKIIELFELLGDALVNP